MFKKLAQHINLQQLIPPFIGGGYLYASIFLNNNNYIYNHRWAVGQKCPAAYYGIYLYEKLIPTNKY